MKNNIIILYNNIKHWSQGHIRLYNSSLYKLCSEEVVLLYRDILVAIASISRTASTSWLLADYY